MIKKVLAIAVLCSIGLFPASIAVRAEEAPEPVTSEGLLDYLEDVISWRRDVAALGTAPGNSLETLLKSTLQKNSVKAMKYAFDFGRAQAVVLDVQGPVNDNDQASQQQEVNKASQQVKKLLPQLNAELAALDAKIRKTPMRLRAPLLADRERLNGEIKLAQARQDLLKSVSNLFNNPGQEEAVTLSAKIDNLARTLPELTEKKKTDAPLPVPQETESGSNIPGTIIPKALLDQAAAEDQEQVSSTGIIRLGTNIFKIYRKKRELGGLAAQTESLTLANQEMLDSLRASLKSSVQRGNELTNGRGMEDAAKLNQDIDALITNFKQLSVAVLPLGQTKYWLQTCMDNLQEWQNSLDSRLNRNLRNLGMRLGILVALLVIPLAISEALRRTTKRYVTDQRRRRQLDIARRIVFSIIIGIIVLLNVIDEFGSIATYIGLLTAGLAVALQNVILSMVSYFFYFGRFGVRVGDRVTIGTITGEVVQIGLIRIYLMELSGPDSELHPTGKIIAFPNSILFQPSAFSKQVPGTNYTWRKITFILDAATDYKLANKALMEAVQGIYEDYHEIMDNQQAALIRATHMNVKIPPPRGYIQFIEAGLAFVIRYPIEISRAAEINERITKKIVDTINKEPSLKLVSSNPPRIQPVAADDL